MACIRVETYFFRGFRKQVWLEPEFWKAGFEKLGLKTLFCFWVWKRNYWQISSKLHVSLLRLVQNQIIKSSIKSTIAEKEVNWKLKTYRFFGVLNLGFPNSGSKLIFYFLSANLKFHKPKNCHFWFTLKGPEVLDLRYKEQKWPSDNKLPTSDFLSIWNFTNLQ